MSWEIQNPIPQHTTFKFMWNLNALLRVHIKVEGFYLHENGRTL